MSLLQAIVERELNTSGIFVFSAKNKEKGNMQESTLFRGDSVATKAVRAYFRIVALDWLQETLTPMIRSIIQHPNESFEVNRNRRKLAKNQLGRSEKVPNNR